MASGITKRRFIGRTAALAVATAASLGLTACGAELNAQTEIKQTAVAGINADTDSVALRDLQVEFESPEGYQAGDNAPLRVWFSVGPNVEATLIEVATEAADRVTFVSGDADEAEEEETPAVGDEPAEGEEEATEEGTEDETTDEGQEETTEQVTGGDINVTVERRSYVRLDKNSLDQAQTPGYLQLEGLKEPLKSGQSVEVTFTFKVITFDARGEQTETEESITVMLPVGQSLEFNDTEQVKNPGAGH